MDTEEQIRRIFDNEIRYDIGNNSGTEDDISFIIEDDTFLVGDLGINRFMESTWSTRNIILRNTK